jgi:hypothetical protein
MKVVNVFLTIALLCLGSICFGQTDTNTAPVQTNAMEKPTTGGPVVESSEFSAYKAKLYHAIESRWSDKTSSEAILLPPGKVRIQYTVSFDGTITTKVLDPGKSSDVVLLEISVKSIEETSPFTRFSDSMRKEIGDSYTDTFVFKTK